MLLGHQDLVLQLLELLVQLPLQLLLAPAHPPRVNLRLAITVQRAALVRDRLRLAGHL